jgi:murein DD-endopeptidase MepM/ murein hydrolase activator NlpD
VAPFVQPAHAYAAGHRGIDLSGDGDAVTAPANGVVAFVGTVVDRGVLTIDHGGGWVSSFEPVTSPLLPGAIVVRGQEVARLAAGGHATLGTLHLGVRYEGEYVNPLLLLGGVPRAVLLPCC